MKRLELDASGADRSEFTNLVKRLVIPRPIAWVSTISRSGVTNLAPHSFFTMASEAPPVAQFTSIGRKDSLRNVLETGEFVINMATEPLFETINETATDFPPEVSEFDAAGVDAEPSVTVRPPRVAGSPSALECRLIETIEVGNGTIILGEVEHIGVSESVLRQGKPDPKLLAPLARLGGIQWSLLGEVREIARIPYEKLRKGSS